MEVTRYDHGTPSWVDYGSGDPDQAAAFYGKLFGWEAQDMGPDAGGYRMCTLRGKFVAGLGPKQDPGPPRWTTYITVNSADEAAELVTANGGQTIVPPMDVFDAGRMAVFADPTGAVFSVWQANQHIGAQLVNEPGALCWNELVTTDVDRSIGFYATVFGWSHVTHPDENIGSYTEFKIGDKTVCGMMPKPPMMPAEVPSHWLVYFAVEDCDTATKEISSLGGQVMRPPMDIPQGRFSIVSDAEGGVLGLFQM